MNKECIKCKSNFIIDSWDENFYAKMKVPIPNVCPDCRFKMRAVWRNEMSLYTGRKCDMCDKNIITMYNPKSPYKVYCNDCYISDKWDPKSYGVDYDPTRPFFEQYNELLINVPKTALYFTNGVGLSVNSEYNNGFGALKNCYFCFNTATVEDSSYNRGITYSTYVTDSYFGKKLDQCYETVNCFSSSKIAWAKNCVGCIDSYFIENCRNCNDCFGCVNLSSKSNCFFNEQLSREEYKEKVNKILGIFTELEKAKEDFKNFAVKFPKKENNNINVQNSIGDYLANCKNAINCMELVDGEDVKNAFSSREIKDSSGTIAYGIKSERLLECVSTGYTSKAIGCYGCEIAQDIEYCYSCLPNNKNLLGCDSIKNSSYCILNKEYEKEEYERIRGIIVKELTDKNIYGLMPPSDIAPYAYNESIAHDNMPLTKEEALAQGFRWEDDIQKTEGRETIKLEEISDNIKDAGDDVLDEILRCTDCNRNYKITEQELFFYRKMNLPIPRKCFYCRHKERVEKRGPYKFWQRNCDNCKKEINTNYEPGRPEIVFCEECYLREVM